PYHATSYHHTSSTNCDTATCHQHCLPPLTDHKNRAAPPAQKAIRPKRAGVCGPSHHFTEPAVSPAFQKRCRSMKASTSGSRPRSEPAITTSVYSGDTVAIEFQLYRPSATGKSS